MYVQWTIIQPLKNNEIMSIALAWVDIEIIILSSSYSDSERQISYDITYMWNLKKGYKCTYLQNSNRLQTLKTNLWLPKGTGGGVSGLGF